LSALAGVLIHKYLLSRKVVVGDPAEVPPLIARPAEVITHALETAVEKVTRRSHHEPHVEPLPRLVSATETDKEIAVAEQSSQHLGSEKADFQTDGVVVPVIRPDSDQDRCPASESTLSPSAETGNGGAARTGRTGE
ncbi:MAG: hypothetical protein NZ703_13610, partial [Gemmataceae bacterium]|nr:hypothetical protein [Gemmataceae bacterium]